MATVALVSDSRVHRARLSRILPKSKYRFFGLRESAVADARKLAEDAAIMFVYVGNPLRRSLFESRLDLVRDLSRRGGRVIAGFDVRSDEALEQVAKAGALDYVLFPMLKHDVLYRIQIAEKAFPSAKSVGVTISAPALEVRLPELHHPSGRIDAKKVAEYLDVPLNALATGIGVNYTSLHKTPAAEAAQPALRPIKRILEFLVDLFADPVRVRTWLRSPRPELEDASPLDTILAGEGGAVLTLLENVMHGIPG